MSRSAWGPVSAALLAGLVVAGCGTQARWVSCEGRLEPINAPAPKAFGEPVPAEPSPSEQTAP